MNAKITIDQFARSLDIDLPDTTSTTLSGFIIEQLGHYQKKHDAVTISILY
jgi:CBS domain containing-hemolysin-like protein